MWLLLIYLFYLYSLDMNVSHWYYGESLLRMLAMQFKCGLISPLFVFWGLERSKCGKVITNSFVPIWIVPNCVIYSHMLRLIVVLTNIILCFILSEEHGISNVSTVALNPQMDEVQAFMSLWVFDYIMFVASFVIWVIYNKVDWANLDCYNLKVTKGWFGITHC